MNRRDGLAGDSDEVATAKWLSRTVALAVDNAAAGQLPFGALIVRDGAVVATGVNTALRDRDPTAHAEVAAVRNACQAVGALHVTGATIVSSCEPCAMCHAAAATAGAARIVYAAPREAVPDLGYPAPPETSGRMAAMQDALRMVTRDQLIHVPTDGADEPFRRFLHTGDRR